MGDVEVGEIKARRHFVTLIETRMHLSKLGIFLDISGHEAVIIKLCSCRDLGIAILSRSS